MIRSIVVFMLSAAMAAAQTWQLKEPGSGLGNSLTTNPLDANILYGSLVDTATTIIWRSTDRGYTWNKYGTTIPQSGPLVNQIKSIAVNPQDTSQLLVGVESGTDSPDRILKSTNSGLTWDVTWKGSFSYYGKPVEFKSIHPDTVYTMGNDTLYRSTNFGSTWDTVMVSRGADHFEAWCDAEIRPDSGNILFIGVRITGIWKSTNYGASWKRVYVSISTGEIPAIAINPLDPRVMYASRFGGGGGIIKSTDWGESWFPISTPVGNLSTWWITCSPVSPDYVYFGVYNTSPGGVYVSADSGHSWRMFKTGLSSQANFNYGLLTLDTLTVIDLHQAGISKLEYPHVINVISPNGGEKYGVGLHHTISWSASNLYAVKLQFSSNHGTSWVTLVDNIPTSQTTYDWLIPNIVSTQCLVRILDRLYTTTRDTSDTTFSILPFQLLSPVGGEHWYGSSFHDITWTGVDFPYVNLYYSLDSGSTWTFIGKRTNTSHYYTWSVPIVNATSCIIKVVNADDTTMRVESDSVFSITTSVDFNAVLRIEDHGLQRDSLIFGAVGGATDNIDSLFGEVPLSPKPSPGTFDVRWNISGTDGTKKDYRDTLGSLHPENLFVCEFQPGSGGYPIALSWEPESLKWGTCILRDPLTHGKMIDVDMRRSGSVVIADSSMHAVEIIECTTSSFSYTGTGGWKMISLPLEIDDRRRASLFPNSLSYVFAYTGGYKQKDTLQYGVGYWLKVLPMTILGCPRHSDTVAVTAGWNMIGTISLPVLRSSVQVDPANLLKSNFYGYAAGYNVATVLNPGEGYWIKAQSTGRIILPSSSSSKKSHETPESEKFPDHHFTISDDEGTVQSLYFGCENGTMNLEHFEMPPPMPLSALDVRFGSNRIAEIHPKTFENDLEYPIVIRSEKNEIFLSWGVENEENFTYILIQRSVKYKTSIQTRLEGSGTLLVRNILQSIFILKVQHKINGAENPREYSLEEPFPNPFNPATNVIFAVPFDANVKLKVYTTLGQEVATLADMPFAAGRHAVAWHGTSDHGCIVSSGVYFIRMIASPVRIQQRSGATVFVSARKVVVVK